MSITYQCSPFHTNSAFHPIIEQLQRAARFRSTDDLDSKLDKLESLLEKATPEVSQVMPLFASLLSLSSDRYPPPSGTPQKQKADTIAALTEQLEGLASSSPVEVLFEDGHWMDPSTLETLESFIARVETLPVLIVVTHRPEFRPAWSFGHLTHISLNRLGRLEAMRLAEELTARKPLPDEVLDQIVAKADGIPLFVEELTKTTLESGLLEQTEERFVLRGPLPPLAIPDTLRDSLMARLDRLSSVKEVAQVGSCMGREFSFSLLRSVAGLGDNKLAEVLSEFVGSELVQRRGEPPDAVYTFKHALVQEAAYESLLKSRRQLLHSRIADVLAVGRQPQVAVEPELLAHHLTEAGRNDEAAEQWLLAGQRAMERAAGREAEAHLERGLRLVEALPHARGRKELALRYHVAAGPVLMMTKGPPAPEVEAAYRAARELSEELGDDNALFKSMFGQWHVYNMRGELGRALGIATESLRFAEASGNDGFELEAHHASWTTQLLRGDFVDCLEHAERGWSLYDRVRHDDHRFQYGHDPGMCSRTIGGIAQWFLGRPDTALACVELAESHARALPHPHSTAIALVHLSHVHYLRREFGHAREAAEAGLEVCSEHGFPAWPGVLSQLRDAALVREGNTEAIVRMRLNVKPPGVPGVYVPTNLTLLEDALLASDEPEDGLEICAQALDAVQSTGQRWLEPEIYRLQAALLAKRGLRDPARKLLETSLSIAREQSAQSSELRTATQLASMVQREGERAQARCLIESLLSRFTEGFDTADLKEAQVRLEQLT